jgi:hypothetical protein
MSWHLGAGYLMGLLILVCAGIVLWPRKPRGLAKPIRDSRSSLEVFKRIRGER